MIINRVSPVTGIVNTMDLDVTDEQWAEWCDPNRKRLVQDIFPNLNDDEREFLISGMTPFDWDEMMREEE